MALAATVKVRADLEADMIRWSSIFGMRWAKDRQAKARHGKKSGAKRRFRSLLAEPLESRQLLTIPTYYYSFAVQGIDEADPLESGFLNFSRRTDEGNWINADLTVSYEVTGSAVPGVDHHLTSGSITLQGLHGTSFDTFKQKNYGVISDGVCEGTETITVTITPSMLSDSGGRTYVNEGGTQLTVNLTDHDCVDPVVTIAANGGGHASENGPTSKTFTLSRTGPTTSSLPVYWSLSGTASSADYTLSGTTTIPANSSSTTVTVTPVDDNISEGSETVTATISSSAAYRVGTPSSAAIIIDDNDPLPTISINDKQVVEGATAAFTVTLSRPSSQAVTVNYVTADGTATSASGDYTASPSTLLTIPAGDTTATIPVPTTNDSLLESSENFYVNLTTSTYATIADGQGEGTITDNDHWQVKLEWLKDAFEYTPNDTIGRKGKFRVTREGETDTSNPLVVQLFATSASTASSSDYQAISTVTIPAYSTSVEPDLIPIDDKLVEDKESVILQIGTDSSSYTISSGMSQGTIWIVDDDRKPRKLKKCECAGETTANQANGSSEVQGADDAAGSLGDNASSDILVGPLVNYSDEASNPIVPVDVTFFPGIENATGLEAKLTIGEGSNAVSGPVVHYNAATQSNSPLAADTQYRFNGQADASSLSTGRYPWSFAITEHYASGSDQTLIYHGYVDIKGLGNSPFGKGFDMMGLDQLVTSSDGALLASGDGNMLFYPATDVGTGYGIAEYDADFSWLGHQSDGTYTLRMKDGRVSKFDSAGKLLSRTDPAGNKATYNYTSGRLTSVQDAVGREVTLTYNADGTVSGIVDATGRTTTLGYSSGRLESITSADPDPTSTVFQPSVVTFGYNAANAITSVTRENDTTKVLDYRSNRSLSAITTGSAVENFTPTTPQAIYIPSEGTGSVSTPASVTPSTIITGSYEDALHNLTIFGADLDGNILWEQKGGYTTSYQYNDKGQMTQMTEPDADGSGVRVTSYTYDPKGNLLGLTHPDGSTEAWTYDGTFNQPLTYTDQLGHKTIYTLNPSNGKNATVRQVIGQLDSVANGETNDLVTSYTYTPLVPTSTNPNAPPAGLVATETDPLNRVTVYEYDHHGNTKSITYAQGTSDEADVHFEYDAADNMTDSFDELERQTKFGYDNLRRRTSMKLPDATGVVSSTSLGYLYEYDGRNRLTKETDPLEQVTIYGYDGRGNQQTVTRPNPGSGAPVTTYNYTLNDQLWSVVDATNHSTHFIHDSLGRQTSTILTDPDGTGTLSAPQFFTTYDAIGRQKTVTDGQGRVVQTTNYSQFGRIITTVLSDPDGTGPLGTSSTVQTFDAIGNLIRQVDALGKQTDYTYDDVGRLTKVLQPDPNGQGRPKTEYTYDKVGNLLTVTDPLNRTTTYEYDKRNRLTKVIQPDADGVSPFFYPTTRYEYDDAGQLKHLIDPLENVTTYDYDTLGRQKSVLQPPPSGSGAGLTTAYEYDAVGQLKKVTDAENRVTSYHYDALGRLDWQTAPMSGTGTAPTTHYTYDFNGNLLTVTDPNNKVTSNAYDYLNRRIRTTDAENGVTNYSYDADSRLFKIEDPVGNATTWVYDVLGRPTVEVNQLGKSRTYQYDALGHLIQKTDRLNRVTQYDYDALGRNTAERWLNSGGNTFHTISYTYDKVGQLTGVTDPAVTYTYSYDNLGRMKTQSQALTDLVPLTYTNAYNSLGLLASTLATVNGAADFANSYEYDDLGRLTQLEQQSQTGGNTVAAKRIDFDYNAVGQFKKIDRYANLAGTQHVISSHYQYDSLGRLSQLVHSTDTTAPAVLTWGTGAKAGYQYTYDAGSRIDSIARYYNGSATTTSYTYDDTNQLLTADHPTGQTDESYTYDANGNRTNGGFSTGIDNLLATDGTYDYVYDAEGNRVSKTDPATGAFTRYRYDHRNRLIGVDLVDPAAATTVSQDQKNGSSTGEGTRWGWGASSISGLYGGSGPWIEDHGWGVTSGQLDGVSISVYGGTEEDGNRDVQVVATGPAGHCFSISSASRSATADVDYGALSGTLCTWVDGEPNHWEFPINNDDVAEGNESFYIYVSGVEGNLTLEGDIGDDDPYVAPNTYDVSIAPVVEGSSLVLSVANDPSWGFSYYVEDVSAKLGVDYSDPHAQNGYGNWTYVPIGSGYSITFPTYATLADSGTRSFKVHVKLWNNYEVVVEADIYDNSGSNLNFTATALSLMEGNDVKLLVVAQAELPFEYWLDDGANSAVAGANYVDANGTDGGNWAALPTSGQLLIPTFAYPTSDGTLSFAIHVRVVGDPASEVTLNAHIFDADGAITSTVEYDYDPFGQLIRRSEDADGPNGTGAATDRFFSWYNGQIALQFDGGSASNLSHRYLWGPAVDQILADEKVSSLSAAGDVIWPLADHLGTTADLAEFDGTATSIINHRRFDSFGNLVESTTGGPQILFGYTGVLFDETTNLQNNRHRWYDATTGQWVSQDPLGLGPDTNPYRYALNGPTNLTDPSGLEPPPTPNYPPLADAWPGTPYPPPPSPNEDDSPQGSVSSPGFSKWDGHQYSFQSRITGQTIVVYSAGTLNAAAPGEVATAFDSTLQKMKIARNTLRLDCALDYYYKESGQPTGMVLKDAAKRKALASQLDTVLSHREAIWFKVETTQSVDSLKRGVPAYTNMYPTSANPGRSIYFSWFGSSLTQVIHINPLFFTKSYAEQEKTVGHELGRYYLGFYTDDSADLWDRLVADLSNPGKIQYLESLQMQLTGQAARAGGG